MLQINALGGLIIEQDGIRLQLTARVDEALLVYLMAHNRPIPRDQLIDLLWQNSNPKQANNNFRSALSRLRKLFGDYLIVTRQTVAFDHTQPHQFDVTQFEAAMVALRPLLDGAAGLDSDQLAALAEAIELYRGDFLAGFVVRGSSAEFEAWALLMQERLRILATAGLQHLTHHASGSGNITLGLRYATQLTALAPLNESAHRLKMRLHLRNRNRSAALQQYAICQQLLRDDLDTEPLNATTTLFEQLQTATPDAGNLPPDRSPFVGRAILVADVIGKLFADDTRLITLTGMGGIGKTRLALTVARHFVGRLLHGVYFVPLVGVTEPSGIVQALAAVLGISEQLSVISDQSAESTVANHLLNHECLIVFDNYEPLLSHPEATHLIETLLRDAPTLRLLITSRESLQLYEETVITLDGLQTDAPTLFTQHATRIGVKSAIVNGQLSIVNQICDLLHGVPLAVELAAGSLRQQDLAAIADGITASFDALQTTMRNVPPRQRSLRAVFDYSWQLLGDEQQKALARLGLFMASFDQEAAAAVNVSVVTLHALLTKSLIQSQPENRFALHPLIREFADEQLREPDRHTASCLFCDYFATTFVHWSKALGRGLTEPALAAWDHDSANVVQAWQLAVQLRDPIFLLRLITPLGNFHNWRNWYVSAETLYASAATALADWRTAAGHKVEALGDIIMRHAYFVFTQGRYNEAAALMHDALPAIKRGGDPRSLDLWHRDLVQIHLKSGNYALVEPLINDLLATSDPTRDPDGHANRLYNSQHFFKDMGDYERAIAMLNEAHEIFEELGDKRRRLMCQYALGNTARAVGDYPRAIIILRDCLAERVGLGDIKRLANAQSSLADALYHSGELDEAQQLAEVARDNYAEINDPIGWPYALNVLGNVARDRGGKAQALAHYQEALGLALKTKRMMKVAELLLDWLLLLEDELESDFLLGGLVAIMGWDSAEFETRRLAQNHLNQRTSAPVPIHSLIRRATI